MHHLFTLACGTCNAHTYVVEGHKIAQEEIMMMVMTITMTMTMTMMMMMMMMMTMTITMTMTMMMMMMMMMMTMMMMMMMMMMGCLSICGSQVSSVGFCVAAIQAVFEVCFSSVWVIVAQDQTTCNFICSRATLCVALPALWRSSVDLSCGSAWGFHIDKWQGYPVRFSSAPLQGNEPQEALNNLGQSSECFTWRHLWG